VSGWLQRHSLLAHLLIDLADCIQVAQRDITGPGQRWRQRHRRGLVALMDFAAPGGSMAGEPGLFLSPGSDPTSAALTRLSR
jgi:hypothetical protein